ncbi:PadR family transcriptional regulator [Dactylosporangium darangshiense]|uniref:Helix-turn-helix transcriptional regulator n=1 Tax=Dactylosporangium darangshiense TaxID=579108 RepID=A0ABP8DDG4_9ACTN
MSIRHGLLALLQRGPMHGYQLRTNFEASTGGTWPLNIGQVYTTLARLERDDLVRALPESEGQRPYEITEAGRTEVGAWFATPVGRADRPRDELAVKLALAITTPGVDVAAVVQAQRTSTMRAMQEYTRLKRSAEGELPWRLVLDAMVFQAEAELRWLDHCETSLLRHAESRPAAPSLPEAVAHEHA